MSLGVGMVLGVLLGGIVPLAVLGCVYVYLWFNVIVVEEKLAHLQQEVSQLNVQAAEVDSLQEDIADYKERERIIIQIKTNRILWSRKLDALATMTPPEIWITKLRVKREDERRAAYRQLLLYREDLENPPLLVVCDLDRFEVHTNFTGTLKTVHAFDLTGLAEPKNLDILRKVFTDPDALKPGLTAQVVTEQAAELIGQLADGMRVRNIPAQRAAHFLMKLMFCMFAEDIELLPGKVFSRIMDTATKGGAKGLADPGAGPRFAQLLRGLFDSMARGGLFGTDEILHFNGGLFADSEVIDLMPGEMLKLRDVSRLDWSALEPSIFGTLFERTLDPERRSQIGAHYTSRQDIVTLLEPVVMLPLRREWAEVKAECDKLSSALAAAKTTAAKRKKIQQRDKTLRHFVERLAHVTILDPACGSGNFLYVALHLLLDLEKEVISFAARHGIGLLPQIRPTQLAGIEINAYAQELASVVIWIGYLQWMHHNGFNPPNNPVLEPIDSIRRMDAILDLADDKGNGLAAELGANAIYCKTDVSSEGDVSAAIEQAVQKFGLINVAVNSAGIATAGRTISKKGPADLKLFELAVKVNLVGTCNVIRLAAMKMF